MFAGKHFSRQVKIYTVVTLRIVYLPDFLTSYAYSIQNESDYSIQNTEFPSNPTTSEQLPKTFQGLSNTA